jgi:hypothetical protein
MDPLQQLVEHRALEHLKARYFWCLDTKDWPGWIGLFTEDATLLVDTGPYTLGRDPRPEPMIVGRKAVGDFVQNRLDPVQTVHHGHNPQFTFHSEAEASGIWAMEDIVETPNRQLWGHGHYHETYRKVDGEWRFASVHLRRLRLVTTFR